MIINNNASAVPSAGLNSHIYSSSYPTPLASESTEQVTLSGFEGPEKLLEIWFCPVNGSDSPLFANHRPASNEDGQWQYRRTGLRTVGRAVWEEMLSIVKCQVLNVIDNECVDAFLLSESSMFVYPHRLILKTCGTTTLLHAVPKILEIAREYCGFHEVGSLFYSRKAFLFPDKQHWPHGRWGDEVEYLDKLFPEETYETGGYVVGKVNGDHWCLYTASPLTLTLDGDGVELADTSSSNGSSVMEEEEEEDDVTLEILMTDLDPAAMKVFWKNEEEKKREKDGEDMAVQGGRRVRVETGIAGIYPQAKVDDYLFDPCGYSLNGALGPYYFTIHVTPEDICSYASFETTVPVKRYYSQVRQGSENEYDTFEDVVQRVIDIFRPGTFQTTLFSRKSVGLRHGKQAGLLEGTIPGFRRRDRIVHCLGKWDLVFCHFDKGATVNKKKVAKKESVELR
ncbi:S-adenosylmethionine decarboxylase [Gaertneriomyces semiglobifer]|nr:S-adenosylmethionine decarboxylase [Gaertneriomyces semiglobifer]